MDLQHDVTEPGTPLPTGPGAQKPRGRRFRAGCLVLVFLPFWLVVGLLAAEVYARYAMGKYWRDGFQLNMRHLVKIGVDNRAEIATHAPDLASLPSFDDQVAAFAKMGDADRLAWAQRRHEVAVVFNSAGEILKCYAPGGEDVGALGDMLKPGAKLKELLPPIYGLPDPGNLTQLLTDAINTEKEGSFRGPKELLLPDGRTILVQMQFRPIEPGKEALLCLRQSIWKVFAQRFRENVEITDNFDWEEASLDTAQFRTNNAGFRGPDISMPKADGVFRILCIGGSTVVEGLTDELTYPGLLQKMLRDYLHTDKVEVVNCGVFGGDTFSESKSVDRYAALQPDMVVYYNFINDFRNFCCTELQHVGGGGQPSGLPLKNALRHSRFVFKYRPSLLVPTEEQLASLLNTHYFPALAEFAGTLRKTGAEIAFCSFVCPEPAKFSAEDKWLFDYSLYRFTWTQQAMDCAGYAASVQNYHSLLKRFCAENHATYLPVAENFPCDDPALFSDICHMVPSGIRKKAETVFHLIRDRVAESMKKPA